MNYPSITIIFLFWSQSKTKSHPDSNKSANARNVSLIQFNCLFAELLLIDQIKETVEEWNWTFLR